MVTIKPLPALGDYSDAELEALNRQLSQAKADIREQQLAITAEIDARLNLERQAQAIAEMDPMIRPAFMALVSEDVRQRVRRWTSDRSV
jgi:hypothetical protein